eukprot:3419271-Pleurochrysis_carterae.AAC.4
MEEEAKDILPPRGDLGAARRSRERVAGALRELACVVEVKEATLAVPAPSRAIGSRRLKESQMVPCPSLSRKSVTRSRGPTRLAVDTKRAAPPNNLRCTATGYYHVVRSGVQGHPIQTAHAFIRRVPYLLIFRGSTWSARPGIGPGKRASAGAGAERAYGWLRVGALRQGRPCALQGLQNSKSGAACECQTATKGDSSGGIEPRERGFTAIYADGGLRGISSATRLEAIRSAAMLYVVPVATNVKTMIYMGLRATLGWILEEVVSATLLRIELVHIYWDIMT